MAKFRPVKHYPTFTDGTHTVMFVPAKDVPGWTHRVVINGVAVDWLADTHKPSGKVAAFFADKHAKKNS